jgi:VWFA-related protein
MKSARALAAVILAVALVALASGQQTLVVDTNLTLLTARVRDTQGNPVLNLQAGDFEILEDGQLRPASHLFLERQSVAIGILVDRSISVESARSAAITSVIQICSALDLSDQALLMSFSTGAKTDVALTSDPTAIISAIHRLKAAAGTRLYDAAIDALDELSASHRERKTLIILTDGADHYSRHTLRQVIDIAHLYRVEIDIIAYEGDDSRSWTAAGRIQIAIELERLASATGGRVLSASDSRSDMSIGIARIMDSLHNVYELGFYSPAWSPESPDIEIRIRDHPELTVFPEIPRVLLEK